MLDRLRVAVRPRSPWEAADLGFALLRSQAGPVYRVWLAVLLPLAVILGLVGHRLPWLAPLLLWWLKPALDRLVLHVLATATFGPAPGLWATLKAAPGFCRRGLVATLLWRRLSLTRSLMLPVLQLEQPTGAAFRARMKVLCMRTRTQVRLLTLVCLAFNLVAVATSVAALAYFWPRGDLDSIMTAVFGSGYERKPWLDIVLSALPTLVMAALEPFYVAAGFGLYLNRRVQLEGWDLELAFRQLAQRARTLASGLALALILGLALAPQALAGPSPAHPGQSEPAPAEPAEPDPDSSGPDATEPAPPEPTRAGTSPAKATLAEVLRAREFGGTETVWRLHRRHPSSPKQSTPMPSPAWLPPLVRILALAIKILLPTLVLAGLAWLLWKYWQPLTDGLRPELREPAPTHLFGLDLRPKALPANLAKAAQQLWDQGDPRAALALLYRGALAHLVHGLRLPISAGATEADCLAQAEAALAAPASAYLARLMAAWQPVAYGAQPAPAAQRDLCQQWAEHFPDRGGRS